jgi:nucleotide-binding universal stress UspA family protein
MIIEARDDVVTLSGRLETNLWLSIQAAAQMLLWGHPNGILINAKDITDCTQEGAKTFLDAIEYIERHKARIVICDASDSIMHVLKATPGVRSQISITSSIEEGRRSLEVATMERSKENVRKKASKSAQSHILGGERLTEHSARPEDRPRVNLSYILTMPRSVPLNAPMPEEESEAKRLFEEAEKLAPKYGINLEVSVSRARDAGDEIADLAKQIGAAKIVLVLPKDLDNAVLWRVFEKAPCEVIVSNERD